jgi:hypothetical protein
VKNTEFCGFFKAKLGNFLYEKIFCSFCNNFVKFYPSTNLVGSIRYKGEGVGAKVIECRFDVCTGGRGVRQTDVHTKIKKDFFK